MGISTCSMAQNPGSRASATLPGPADRQGHATITLWVTPAISPSKLPRRTVDWAHPVEAVDRGYGAANAPTSAKARNASCGLVRGVNKVLNHVWFESGSSRGLGLGGPVPM